MRVLIIEDDGLMSELLRATFEPLGHRVYTSTTGDEIERLLEVHDPDVVLLDVLLFGSERDGFEVARRIKDSPYRDTMVILITALDDEESRRRGKQAGADAYLAKPFSPLELLEMVENRRAWPRGG